MFLLLLCACACACVRVCVRLSVSADMVASGLSFMHQTGCPAQAIADFALEVLAVAEQFQVQLSASSASARILTEERGEVATAADRSGGCRKGSVTHDLQVGQAQAQAQTQRCPVQTRSSVSAACPLFLSPR